MQGAIARGIRKEAAAQMVRFYEHHHQYYVWNAFWYRNLCFGVENSVKIENLNLFVGAW